jgi:hypothetical protein
LNWHPNFFACRTVSDCFPGLIRASKGDHRQTYPSSLTAGETPRLTVLTRGPGPQIEILPSTAAACPSFIAVAAIPKSCAPLLGFLLSASPASLSPTPRFQIASPDRRLPFLHRSAQPWEQRCSRPLYPRLPPLPRTCLRRVLRLRRHHGSQETEAFRILLRRRAALEAPPRWGEERSQPHAAFPPAGTFPTQGDPPS